MKAFTELQIICKESTKIADWRITYIQTMAEIRRLYKLNSDFHDSVIIIKIQNKKLIISSFNYDIAIVNFQAKLDAILNKIMKGTDCNSVIVDWNIDKGVAIPYPFNV